jgi:acetyltransferase-like isoleucine patch superfamily enzyme
MMIVDLMAMFLPFRIRKYYYIYIKGWELADDVFVGFTYINIKRLKMGVGSRIGHLNVIKGLNLVEIGDFSIISNLNWITAFPSDLESNHFRNTSRSTCLVMGMHSAITSRHLIDCTNLIRIGSFTTVAGFRTQMLTHSINIEKCAQEALPIEIGDYVFIGTSSVLLPGVKIPNFAVIGASSLLNKAYDEQYALYGGVPARFVKKIPIDSLYFTRKIGYVD